MPENITQIKLKFSCGENWEAMHPAENGGRHCNQCHKVVYDFTNSKADEFRKILVENNYNVCGRFTSDQMVATAFPFWKRWVSAAMVLIGFNVFSGTKAAAQKQINKSYQPTKIINSDSVDSQDYKIGIIDGPIPEFKGGNTALSEFLKKNIRYIKGSPNNRVIASFVINKSGKLTDIKILRGLSTEANNEVIRVLKLSPKWNPGKLNGKPVDTQFYLPVSFSDK